MLSFSENRWSIRLVKKFSLTIWFPEKTYSPMSPFARETVLLGACQKVRKAAAFGSTGTVFVKHDPSAGCCEHKIPLRALIDGTVVSCEIPFPCRMPS